MDLRLIISAGAGIILSFLIKDSEAYLIRAEKRGERRLIGSIFKGKVKRLSKSLNGVFLDIGLDKEAYMLLRDFESDLCQLPKIGDEIIVQMKRTQIDDKGAKVSCRISIPGKNIVYLPTDKKVFISSKIKDDLKRKKLKELISKVLEEGGAIVRTSAEASMEEELLEELKKLKEKWQEILERAKDIKVGMIYEEYPIYIQMIRNFWNNLSEIAVDDRDIWHQILTYLEENCQELIGKVRYVKNLSVFFKKYELDRALSKLFSKYVWLKGGGYIVIEETEAMTVIDVNSGSGSGTNLEENALKTNLEAAEEIARQIKLRDLGGIIVIDFIDMKEKEHKRILVEKMRELFSDEGTRVHIYGLTHLGLLEMTRKKENLSVTRILSTECVYCKGKGFIKSPEIVLYEIEKEISYFKGRYIEIRVNPALKRKVQDMVEKCGMGSWVSVEELCEAPLDYYEIILR